MKNQWKEWIAFILMLAGISLLAGIILFLILKNLCDGLR